MTTLAELAANAIPEPMAIDAIPEDPEFHVELTGKSQGGKTKLAGKLDDAGSVRVQVYLPEGYQAGPFAVTQRNLRAQSGRPGTDNGVRRSTDGKVTILTFDRKDCTVVFFAPSDAPAPKKVSINF